jgi:hypothetical protein
MEGEPPGEPKKQKALAPYEGERVRVRGLVREGGLRLYGNDFSRVVFSMPSRLKPCAYRRSQPALAKKSAKADFVCMGTTSVGCSHSAKSSKAVRIQTKPACAGF